MNKYYKRVENTKLLQLWVEKEEKLIPLVCEREYYGEGLGENDLIPIEESEFENLAWLFNH